MVFCRDFPPYKGRAFSYFQNETSDSQHHHNASQHSGVPATTPGADGTTHLLRAYEQFIRLLREPTRSFLGWHFTFSQWNRSAAEQQWRQGALLSDTGTAQWTAESLGRAGPFALTHGNLRGPVCGRCPLSITGPFRLELGQHGVVRHHYARHVVGPHSSQRNRASYVLSWLPRPPRPTTAMGLMPQASRLTAHEV